MDGNHLPVADMAASFQAAVVDVLFQKTLLAAREFGVKEIIIGGGVSANKSLREAFLAQKEFPLTSHLCRSARIMPPWLPLQAITALRLVIRMDWI